MSTENIQKFLQTAYSDEKLVELLAHAQDGKLQFNSCCCLLGITNATHTLMSEEGSRSSEDGTHHIRAKELPFARQAEHEFADLCYPTMDDGRKRLIPLILAEMERRSNSDHRPVTDEDTGDPDEMEHNQHGYSYERFQS